MPYSKEHKEKSRERILQSASNLFPRLGYEAVSIDMLMRGAGLTRGAFYAHFKNKDEVYAESIVYASLKSPFVEERASIVNDAEWFEKTIAKYLSRQHIDATPSPCPLAFLVTDINHRDEAVRNTYTRVYKNLTRLIQHRAKENGCDRESVMAATAMMIGGVAVARALDDSRIADKLLVSCREVARGLLGFEE